MPKSNLDWLGVVSLWLGAIIMAFKAADAPLPVGAPNVLSSDAWNYVPIVLVTFYLGLAIYRQFRPTVQAVRSPRPPPVSLPPLPPVASLPASDDGRVFLSASTDPSAIMALCENKTSLHAQQAVAPYIGKWLRFRGRVFDVSMLPPSDKMRIAFESEGLSRVRAYSRKDASLADVIHKGDTIEVIGRIEEIDEFRISLEDAEITAR